MLVVDDSPHNCIVARGHLEAAGHDVACLSSGEEALEMLATERFDLVILDVLVTLDADPARSGSHGLGLTFCRLAAEAHGARIWVEERPGGGASFCVRIPQPAGPEPVRSRSRRDPVE